MFHQKCFEVCFWKEKKGAPKRAVSALIGKKTRHVEHVTAIYTPPANRSAPRVASKTDLGPTKRKQILSPAQQRNEKEKRKPR